LPKNPVALADDLRLVTTGTARNKDSLVDRRARETVSLRERLLSLPRIADLSKGFGRFSQT